MHSISTYTFPSFQYNAILIKILEHKKGLTVMEQVDYKQYLAPKSHQELECLLHHSLLLSSEKKLGGLIHVMTIAI